MAGFEPGLNPIGITPLWEMAWTDEGSCDGSTPTALVQPYEPNAHYEYGDVVTNKGKQWRCKAVWPETFRCSQAGYAPGEPYNGVALYEDIWEETIVPTASPSAHKPSHMPSLTPSMFPSTAPSNVSSTSHKPSLSLSESPSNVPSSSPSEPPSNVPSAAPSDEPSMSPSESPSTSPSEPPSSALSESPSHMPSLSPSESKSPTNVPSAFPSETSTPTETCGASTSSWAQLGVDIDGEADKDRFGWSVSLSANGQRVAIGARLNDGSGFDNGHARVYQYDTLTSTWTQLGQDLDGEEDGDGNGDESGFAVSLSADGNRVAVGARFNGSVSGSSFRSGHARVYQYDTLTSTWTQLGQDLDGEAAGDEAGRSVSLSADGQRVAVGAPSNDANGDKAGQVRVYEYDGDTSTWVQLGQDILGEAAGDELGYAVSLSADGNRVAIGARRNDANGADSGRVRVHEYSSSGWTLLGQAMDGVGNDYSGNSVSLSSDGNIVAIGAWARNAGNARVYQYDILTSTWTQLGQDILGEATGDWSGWSLSLSGDGKRVAVGAPYNKDANGRSRGQARVYEYCASFSGWTQLGQDMDGIGGDILGWSVAISSDGERVAMGAPTDLVDETGYVRVYEF